MKIIDFSLFLNYPSVAFGSLGLFALVVFLPPRLKVYSWRKLKNEMDRWVAQKLMSESVTPAACSLCNGSRINRRVMEVLPENMEASFLSVRQSGQITYAEYRCAGCGSEIGRASEVSLSQSD